MKLSKHGLTVLNAQYRSVLKKCLLVNIGLVLCATNAIAEEISLVGKEDTITGNFQGWKINLNDAYAADDEKIDTSKSVEEIKTDLQNLTELFYSTNNYEQQEVSKVSVSDGATLNLNNVRLLVDAKQNTTNADGSIDAIVVKGGTINLTNSSLDASSDEGDKIFNTKFDKATLKLVNSELPIDGAVSFTNGSKLSISALNYFDEDEVLDMLHNDENALKMAEALQGKTNENGALWPSGVELKYTNADGTTGTIDSGDIQTEQSVELRRLTIDNSEVILGDSDNPEDRAAMKSDSQIFIQNNSKVVLNNRAYLGFDYEKYTDEEDIADRNEIEALYGKANMTIDHSQVILNDNSQLNVRNEAGATTVIQNNSQIFMNDSSQMNLNAVSITDSQIHMKDNAILTMDSVVLQKAAIHGTGTNKVIIAGENATTFEDTSLEITDANAIQVNKNGHFKIQAKNDAVAITGSSADEAVIYMAGEADEITKVEFNGGSQGITVDGAIISKNKKNELNLAGQVELNGLLDPLTANISDGNITHAYYADEIDFNLNNGGTLKYTSDKYLYDATKHTHNVGETRDENTNTFADGNYALNSINFNGGTLDIANGATSSIKLAKLNLATDSNINVDADLANETMDTISADTIEGNAKLNISNLNLISDAKNEITTINFTNDEKLLSSVNYTGKTSGLQALSPIYSYDVAYDKDSGDFTFTRGDGNKVEDYNSTVYANSVVGQAVALLQSNIASTVFSSMTNNSFATAPNELPQKDNVWISVRGYDEDIDFKSFNNVDSKTYTLTGGVNSDTIHYDTVDAIYGVYAGYLDGEQKFEGNNIDQKGGYVGLSALLSKDNTSLLGTVNGGYIDNENNHAFGSDSFDTYFTGIALKATYDYKLSDSLSILPNIYAGYTFVNSEDFTSKSDVKVKNDNLHFWEVAPGIQINKAFNNGWNTYVQAKYAFVENSGGDANIDNVALPDISAKNYVEYGLGANKDLNNNWSFAAEINRREGGREGWDGNINIRYNF